MELVTRVLQVFSLSFLVSLGVPLADETFSGSTQRPTYSLTS
jgi:hypothetical protein